MSDSVCRPGRAVAWRLLDTPPAPGAWNMALDAALMDRVRAGAAPVLRFYRWDPACLSLGRNQPARGRYDLDAIARLGLDVVRRPTGGRAVLHEHELTYSVAAPLAWFGGPRRSYAAINRALVQGLRRLGVPATLQPRGERRAAAPSISPCFQEPAEGEVVASGRKLVGSAQCRDGSVLLQHGSLLLDGDQSAVRSLVLLPDEVAAEAQQPATLAGLLGSPPPWEAVTDALAQGWADTVGAEVRREPVSAGEADLAAALAARFCDPAWTWRL